MITYFLDSFRGKCLAPMYVHCFPPNGTASSSSPSLQFALHSHRRSGAIACGKGHIGRKLRLDCAGLEYVFFFKSKNAACTIIKSHAALPSYNYETYLRLIFFTVAEVPGRSCLASVLAFQ